MRVNLDLQFDKSLCPRLQFVALASLISLLITSSGFTSVSAAIVIRDPLLDIELVTQGLKFPTAMTFLNPNEILVLEKDNGKVLRVVNGNVSESAVLNLNVNHLNERGLLGMALQNKSLGTQDERAETKYVFLFYTESRQASNSTQSTRVNNITNCKILQCQENQYSNRLYRYEYKDNKLVNPKLLIEIPIYWNNRVYPTTYSAILEGESNWLHYPLREGIHQGGKIVIGPDNYIYLATGDGGGCLTHDSCYRSIKNGFLSVKTANKIDGTDPIGMGGILRLDNHGFPSTDKGVIGEGRPLNYYYAYGIRNSFGLDFDPVTGNLWDSENGPHFGDEINLVEPGFNSGWAKVQGVWPVINYSYLYPNSTQNGVLYSSKGPVHKNLEDFNGNGKYSDPEFTWNASIGVTSIKFLNTDKYGKAYENDLFAGDAYGRIYHFDLNEKRTALDLKGPLEDKVANSRLDMWDLIVAQGLDTITDMQVGPDGYLYVLSYSGKILKIIPKVAMQ